MLASREFGVFAVSALVCISLLFNRPYLFAGSASVLVVLLLWDVVRATMSRFAVPRTKEYKISVTDLRADGLASAFKPVLSMRTMKKIQERIEDRLKPEILRSGMAENPRILGMKSVLYSIISCIAVIPVAGIVSAIYGMIFLGIALVPPLVAGMYFVRLRMKASERRNGIMDELPTFAVLASIMESVNISMFSVLLAVAEAPTNIFTAIRKEGRRAKDIAVLGKSPTEALLELADSHPNVTFRDFVEGYVSSFNTGGSDTSKYLQEQAARFFRMMQLRMTGYAKHADMIAQLVLTLMMLLPMMGLSMMFFATGQMAGMMMMMLTAIFPFVTVVLIAIIHSKQPKNADTVRASWIMLPAGAAATVVIYMLQGSTWEIVGAGVVAASFCNMVFTQKKFRENQSSDEALPEFMRQITRFKNIGFDIIHAIREMRADIVQRRGLSRPPKFNAFFDGIIDSIYRVVISGNSLERAVTKTKIASRNARLVFFILGKVNESGGGTTKTINEITRWVAQYHDARKEMIANLRSSLITAFIGPALMVLMMTVSDQLASSLEENSDALSEFAGMSASFAASAEITGMSQILVVVAAACMGVVLSKINYFTVSHTVFTGIITAATMAMLYASPYIPEFGL